MAALSLLCPCFAKLQGSPALLSLREPQESGLNAPTSVELQAGDQGLILSSTPPCPKNQAEMPALSLITVTLNSIGMPSSFSPWQENLPLWTPPQRGAFGRSSPSLAPLQAISNTAGEERD